MLRKEDVCNSDIDCTRLLHVGSVSLSDNPCREAIGYAMQTALAYGNASGALCVQKSGGIPALPTREEIEEELK